MGRAITVKGHYGSYDFTETVLMADDDDRNPVDVAFAQMKRKGYLTLHMASMGGEVVDVKRTETEE